MPPNSKGPNTTHPKINQATSRASKNSQVSCNKKIKGSILSQNINKTALINGTRPLTPNIAKKVFGIAKSQNQEVTTKVTPNKLSEKIAAIKNTLANIRVHGYKNFQKCLPDVSFQSRKPISKNAVTSKNPDSQSRNSNASKNTPASLRSVKMNITQRANVVSHNTANTIKKESVKPENNTATTKITKRISPNNSRISKKSSKFRKKTSSNSHCPVSTKRMTDNNLQRVNVKKASHSIGSPQRSNASKSSNQKGNNSSKKRSGSTDTSPLLKHSVNVVKSNGNVSGKNDAVKKDATCKKINAVVLDLTSHGSSSLGATPFVEYDVVTKRAPPPMMKVSYVDNSIPKPTAVTLPSAVESKKIPPALASLFSNRQINEKTIFVKPANTVLSKKTAASKVVTSSLPLCPQCLKRILNRKDSLKDHFAEAHGPIGTMPIKRNLKYALILEHDFPLNSNTCITMLKVHLGPTKGTVRLWLILSRFEVVYKKEHYQKFSIWMLTEDVDEPILCTISYAGDTKRVKTRTLKDMTSFRDIVRDERCLDLSLASVRKFLRHRGGYFVLQVNSSE